MKTRDVDLGRRIALDVARDHPALLDHEHAFYSACFDSEVAYPGARGGDPESLCRGYQLGRAKALEGGAS